MPVLAVTKERRAGENGNSRASLHNAKQDAVDRARRRCARVPSERRERAAEFCKIGRRRRLFELSHAADDDIDYGARRSRT